MNQTKATVIQNKQIRLKSVTGDPLNVFGAAELQLKFNRQQTISHNFIIAELPLNYGILGFDFLNQGHTIFSTRPPVLRDAVTQNCTELFCSIKDLPTKKEEEGMSSMIRPTETTPFMVECSNPMNSAEKLDRERAENMCKNILNDFPELSSSPDYNKPCHHKFRLDIDLVDETPLVQGPRRCSALDR